MKKINLYCQKITKACLITLCLLNTHSFTKAQDISRLQQSIQQNTQKQEIMILLNKQKYEYSNINKPRLPVENDNPKTPILPYPHNGLNCRDSNLDTYIIPKPVKKHADELDEVFNATHPKPKSSPPPKKE